LEQKLPDGQLVDRAWLRAQGFGRPRVDYFLRAGKLTAVAHGIYRRPGPPLKWEHVVYSLNQMGCTVRVGGRSALELQGMAHYLPLGDAQRIDLYGVSKVPSWVRDFQKPFQFAVHIQRLFDSLPRAALHQRLFGAWDWPIPFSLPELAILELLAEVRDEADFSTVDKFFESAVNLRPALLQDLLRNCRQVKAKRLFLWFSDRHNHTWRQSLDTEEVDLGRGKRMIVKGGSYNPAYQITVPKQMAVGEESPLY
jgi:hypothetical protein